jgi:ApaG protein
MISKISEGVNISVESFYEAGYSNLAASEFMFAYRITIENNNNFPIKLISRRWQIFDSNATKREVVGDGVVGEQPEIDAGKSYQYVSGCNLNTELGSMQGTYEFKNLFNKQMFEVKIPLFQLVVPFKLN